MRTNKAGIKLIKHFEGFPNGGYPYRDPVGVWTRGYGRTKGIHGGSPRISEQRASDELRELLRTDYEPYVNRIKGLNENRHAALVSFIYNLGPGVIDASTQLGRWLREGRFLRATVEMALYRNAGGQVFAGLVRRRAAEIKLFRTRTKNPRRT